VRYQDWKHRRVALLLFALSIVCLWVSFNALFMVPGPYDSTTNTIAGAGIVAALGFAAASGKQFIAATTSRRIRPRRLWSTTPVIAWLVIVLVFGGMLLLERM
jgi:hypothetical protein